MESKWCVHMEDENNKMYVGGYRVYFHEKCDILWTFCPICGTPRPKTKVKRLAEILHNSYFVRAKDGVYIEDSGEGFKRVAVEVLNWVEKQWNVWKKDYSKNFKDEAFITYLRQASKGDS